MFKKKVYYHFLESSHIRTQFMLGVVPSTISYLGLFVWKYVPVLRWLFDGCFEMPVWQIRGHWQCLSSSRCTWLCSGFVFVSLTCLYLCVCLCLPVLLFFLHWSISFPLPPLSSSGWNRTSATMACRKRRLLLDLLIGFDLFNFLPCCPFIYIIRSNISRNSRSGVLRT